MTLLTLAWVALLAAAATAGVYRVELVGGRAFETRYLPIEDPGSPARVLLLTDAGNWIALPREMVESVVVEIEERGFGKRLDAYTIAVGPSPNDRPVPESVESRADPLAALAALFERRFESLPLSHVDQFVEPEEAEGIPLRYTAGNLPAVGAPERFVTPQERP